LQDSRFKPFSAAERYGEEERKKEIPIVSMDREEREKHRTSFISRKKGSSLNSILIPTPAR
jgi:hypothetical protein